MARFFAGTRALLACRGPGAFEWQTTIGSPARFDNSATTGVAGAVGVSTFDASGNSSAFLQIPLGMDATNTTGTLWGTFTVLVGGTGGSIGGDFFFSLINDVGVRIIDSFYSNFSSLNQTARFWNGAGHTTMASWTGINVLTKYTFRLVHGASSSFTLYANNVVVFSAPINNAAVNNTSFMRIYGAHSGTLFNYYSQVALADFDLRSYVFPEDVLTAFGAYNEGVGTIAGQSDMDLSTVYTLAANGNRVTGTKAARTLPTGASIRAVQVTGLERVNAPIANSQKLLRIGGVDYTSASVTPAPNGGIEPRAVYWDNDPSTAAPWAGVANYNAAEPGHRAAT